MEIYERMFKRLDERNIKDSEFARRIGKNQSVIATWRARGKNPPIELAFQICEILEISLEYLITGKEKELSREEQEIITAYRAAGEGRKEAVRDLLHVEYEEEEQERSSGSRTG